MIVMLKACVHDAQANALVGMQEIKAFLVAVSWAKRAKEVREFVAVSASNLGIHITSHNYFIVLRMLGND
jgi:hypothetical protein